MPADVELPDKLVAGLTARQVVITAIAVLVIWAGFEATRRVLPLPVFAVLAAPVAVAATALAIGQRDGLTLDRLLAAAWRQARSPRRMVTAPEGVPAAAGLGRARAGPPGRAAAGPGDAAVAAGHPGRGDRAGRRRRRRRLRGVDGELRAAQPGRAGRADRRLRPVAALADRPGADPDPHRPRATWPPRSAGSARTPRRCRTPRWNKPRWPTPVSWPGWAPPGRC